MLSARAFVASRTRSSISTRVIATAIVTPLHPPLALPLLRASHSTSSDPSFDPNRLKKISPAIATLQAETWSQYVATGRGCRTLFQLINTDSSSQISMSELKFFLQNVKDLEGVTGTTSRGGSGGINRAARKRVLEAVSDNFIGFPEFQRWLIEATKVDPGGMTNSDLQRGYEAAPSTGPRDETKDAEYGWNMGTMSQSLRRMQYAVRGEVVMRADALAAEGRRITYTNIGNPHAVGQDPITFYRQVMALCDLPADHGVDHPVVSSAFPEDAVRRAREMRAAIGSSGTGAYTNSQGITAFRQHVADYISERDGHPSYPGNIFLTNGASSAIEMVLTGLIAETKDAIMIPIPQYPIYSALIGRLGGRQVGYYLDEDSGWTVTEEELEKRLTTARDGDGLEVKALTLINPGNPTGQVLGRKDLEVICKFCAKWGIVLLADEVYQRNVYVDDREFISAKKVAIETPGCESLQLVSFHSTSKGLIGECGRRGGYMEMHRIDPFVQTQIYKLASSGLCSGVAGQIMTSLMVSPPVPGEASHELFTAEESGIMESLKRRAVALVEGLDRIDGISCLRAEGAMYAFPQIELPARALEEAERKGQTPDTLYALSLLEETGICVVPASGFGQKEGRIGFRTTFLPPEEEVMTAIREFGRHHKLFCEKYA